MATVPIFDCGWSLLNHGVAQRKRLNLGNLNPIYERELTKRGVYQEEGRWKVATVMTGRGGKDVGIGNPRGERCTSPRARTRGMREMSATCDSDCIASTNPFRFSILSRFQSFGTFFFGSSANHGFPAVELVLSAHQGRVH